MGAPAPSGRALQRALVEVLGALGTGRIPELLRLRYAEALEPPAVWRRLGIGKSEYYRSHGRGVLPPASHTTTGARSCTVTSTRSGRCDLTLALSIAGSA